MRKATFGAVAAATALTLAAIAAFVSNGSRHGGALAAAPQAATGGAQDGADWAVFAGGCFWCVEADFDKVDGVLETISGYAGGHLENPTYRQVTRGGTGHLEVVRVRFDPDVVVYADLVAYFWRTIDPLDDGGQFCDRGESYKTAVFVRDDSQRTAAEASKASAEGALGQSMATEIRVLDTFYPAEDYHQDYYKKNPLRYRYYRTACGRDERIREVWGADG